MTTRRRTHTPAVRIAEKPSPHRTDRRPVVVPTMVALPRDGGVLAHASVAHHALERAAEILRAASDDLPMWVGEALAAELRQAALHVDMVATEAARLPLRVVPGRGAPAG